MRDPHVVSLRYRLVPGERITFDRPQPIERETKAFRMRLADGVLTFELKEHYADEETAKRAVDGFRRNWEIYACLELGHEAVRFVYERADVADQRGDVVMRQTRTATSGAYIVRPAEPLARYPEPPNKFVVSPDVEAMWFHYQQFRSGHERLVDMGNFCLTVLEESAGGGKRRRKAAADRYSIEFDVLDTLGRLTGAVGDYKTARKAKGLAERRPHTGAEKDWIEAAVKKLIRRVGQWACDPGAPLPQITMPDLPKL